MITGIGERSRVFPCVPPARSPMLVNMEIHSVRAVIYLLGGIILLLVPLACTTPSTQPSKTDAPPSIRSGGPTSGGGLETTVDC